MRVPTLILAGLSLENSCGGRAPPMKSNHPPLIVQYCEPDEPPSVSVK
jgi:hypothetical protein